jgi:hypothetical protein
MDTGFCIQVGILCVFRVEILKQNVNLGLLGIPRFEVRANLKILDFCPNNVKKTFIFIKISDQKCVCSTVCIRHDQLIPPPSPPPLLTHPPNYLPNGRMRSCVYLFNPKSTIWPDQKRRHDRSLVITSRGGRSYFKK